MKLNFCIYNLNCTCKITVWLYSLVAVSVVKMLFILVSDHWLYAITYLFQRNLSCAGFLKEAQIPYYNQGYRYIIAYVKESRSARRGESGWGVAVGVTRPAIPLNPFHVTISWAAASVIPVWGMRDPRQPAQGRGGGSQLVMCVCVCVFVRKHTHTHTLCTINDLISTQFWITEHLEIYVWAFIYSWKHIGIRNRVKWACKSLYIFTLFNRHTPCVIR